MPYRVISLSTLCLIGCGAPGLPLGVETSDATSTSGETASENESGTGLDTESESADADSDDDSGTTGKSSVCGDNIVAPDEACDDGNQLDTDECLSDCTIASCGDGHIHAGEEMCDDGNLDQADGCTSGCTVPRTCLDLSSGWPDLADGVYVVDPDGEDADPPFSVYCDMTTANGGWTLVERSGSLPDLDRALYVDFPLNEGLPSATPHRLSRASMASLLKNSDFMRIDCRGDDYLLTDALNLFNGEGAEGGCANWTMVHYIEAQLKGHALTDVIVCTWNISTVEGCAGAWHIDEGAQNSYCGLQNYPWTEDATPITSPSADTFTVNPNNSDLKEPIHDCHEDGAERWVMLR